jgi:hypothetical protein
MPNDPEHAGKSPSHSFFPTAEAPSFCSRRTPLVPARDDLRTFELEHARADASGTQRIPEVSDSSRPTYVPDEPMDVIEAMADSGPVVTVATPSVLEVPRVEDFESKPPTIPAPPPTPGSFAALAHPLEEPQPGGLTRRRGRALFARALFVMLFGGVATLLGYAFKPQLAGAYARAQDAVQLAFTH